MSSGSADIIAGRTGSINSFTTSFTRSQIVKADAHTLQVGNQQTSPFGGRHRDAEQAAQRPRAGVAVTMPPPPKGHALPLVLEGIRRQTEGEITEAVPLSLLMIISICFAAVINRIE